MIPPAVPVLDCGVIAQVALRRVLETGDVLGRDHHGRTIIAVAVEDWMVDSPMASGGGHENLEREPAEDDDGA